jgi:hypothetical protein
MKLISEVSQCIDEFVSKYGGVGIKVTGIHQYEKPTLKFEMKEQFFCVFIEDLKKMGFYDLLDRLLRLQDYVRAV